uniref:Uncharacterized protein n=1 Tax=Cacopsylla melanoneura TaxID=428564 RepID=A0A8D8QZ83_9HEMI
MEKVNKTGAGPSKPPPHFDLIHSMLGNRHDLDLTNVNIVSSVPSGRSVGESSVVSGRSEGRGRSEVGGRSEGSGRSAGSGRSEVGVSSETPEASASSSRHSLVKKNIRPRAKAEVFQYISDLELRMEKRRQDETDKFLKTLKDAADKESAQRDKMIKLLAKLVGSKSKGQKRKGQPSSSDSDD